LEKNIESECSEVLKARLRIATNVYFPVTLSALSIPPWSKKIYSKIGSYYEMLEKLPESKEKIIKEFIQPALKGVSYKEILQAYDRLKESKENKGKKFQKDIYQDEYMVLTREEESDEEYSSQLVDVPMKYREIINKVSAIDKLTEVVTMLGFTRLKSWSGKIDDRKIAPISSKYQNWLPAVQMKGEGIFIEFNLEKLNKWAESVGDYYMPMLRNLEKSFLSNDRVSPQYVLLHTFSHLLIRQLSLECGYSAASLKEKIYSTFCDDHGIEMAGVLIYTSSSDSDGSLGGLVEQSDKDKLG